MVIGADNVEAVNNATVKFGQTVTDPKAAVLPAYNFFSGEPGVSLLMFYDGPTPPDGIFDDYLAIPSSMNDVKTRSFVDFVGGSSSAASSRYVLIIKETLICRPLRLTFPSEVSSTQSPFWSIRRPSWLQFLMRPRCVPTYDDETCPSCSLSLPHYDDSSGAPVSPRPPAFSSATTSSLSSPPSSRTPQSRPPHTRPHALRASPRSTFTTPMAKRPMTT